MSDKLLQVLSGVLADEEVLFTADNGVMRISVWNPTCSIEREFTIGANNAIEMTLEKMLDYVRAKENSNK